MTGFYGDIFEINAPASGTALSALPSNSYPGVTLRGAVAQGTNILAAGVVQSGVGLAVFNKDAVMTSAIDTDMPGEGAGIAPLDGGGYAVASASGATTSVLFLDASFANPVASRVQHSFGRAIAAGVGGGAVAISSSGVFRFAANGSLTWQKSVPITTGNLVTIVRWGSGYAVVGNVDGAAQVLYLDDSGVAAWQVALNVTPAAGTPQLFGATVISVGGQSRLWVGGAISSGAYEWVLSNTGSIIDGGGYGSGRAVHAIGTGDDLMVFGTTLPGILWVSRHSMLYGLPGTCVSSASTPTAASTSLVLSDLSLTPTITTPTLSSITRTSTPSVPQFVDSCQ